MGLADRLARRALSSVLAPSSPSPKPPAAGSALATLDLRPSDVRPVDTLALPAVTVAALDGPSPRERQLIRRLDFAADQLRDTGGSGDPIMRLIRRLPGHGAEHASKLFLFEALRETLPVLNAAIMKRRFVEGVVNIESTDPGLRTALRDFAERLPVQNYADASALTGLDTFLDLASENADTFGLAPVELVVGLAGIERAVAPTPRSFYFKTVEQTSREADAAGVERSRTRRFHELRQSTSDGDTAVGGPFVRLLTFSPDPVGPWGRPLAWGMPFVAEILVRMLVSLNNLWWKSGDPSTFWQINYERGPEGQLPDTADIQEDADDLERLVGEIYKGRASGKVGDVFFGIAGGKVESKAIGENLLINSLAPYLRDHYTAVAGQVVATSDLPAWMFPAGVLPGGGLNSDLASVEANAAALAAYGRNVRRGNVARFILDAFLLLDRRAGALSRYTVGFDVPSMVDPGAAETARKTGQEANGAAIDNAMLLQDSGVFTGSQDVADYLAGAGVLPAGWKPRGNV